MSEGKLLEVRALHAGYGQIEVLHDLTLVVEPGELVAIVGGNGAGKTTTMRALTGLLAIEAGEITLAGERLEHVAAHDRVARGLVLCPEGRRIFPRLTVRENLDLGAYLRRDRAAIDRDLEHVYALFPILKERSAQLGGTLSGGEQQMLAVGRALMADPKLLLLDEPSLGLSPLLTQRIFAALKELNEEGLAILLVEQNVHTALAVSRRTYVLENGRVVRTGPSARLARDPAIKAAYLGVAHDLKQDEVITTGTHTPVPDVGE